MLKGVTLFRDKRSATRGEYAIVRDIAVSSVATDLSIITKFLYNKGVEKWTEYKEILESTELPSENLRRKLENLTLLKVILKRRSSMTIYYSIEPEISELIKEGNIY